MIKSEKNWQGYRNEVTNYLDRYLIKCEGYAKFFGNYIYPNPQGSHWIIRVPGASRGNIEIIDGVIKSITLYEDSFCYDKKVFDELNQFIGRKIDLN